MFELEFINQIEDDDIKKQLWEILCECDQEFIPPLSSRDSSSQKELSDLNQSTVKPISYFEKMMEQKFILVFNKPNEVVAFMTFIHHYSCEELQAIGFSNYITTICVRKNYRNQGILSKLYDYMEGHIEDSYIENYISTRTWSTNVYHLKTLKNRGYEMGTVLKDHRGEGIDTIYLYKDTQWPNNA
ncbi:ribosomal protein S18 acetylase RimI-like enzyme [Natranaerovirga hydrolytica]|uniref:Ribosomal protein S18 acetylase RimI-like enzyme n=1 Tax=Natranaerovirga hydrolytica TaxID=680378 RepID=A0A4V2Q1M1_9FIRM|nr:GNAT family N-acetyltransferase [Natranaerovirga hydrolytica]TCK98141.1 ribosomal protein S18 acetylase RimI-like enzyme [Natranaerovirga hydrolytica]